MTLNDNASDGTSTTAVTDVTTIPSRGRVQVVIPTRYDQVPDAYRPLSQMVGQGIGSGRQMAVTATAIRE